MVILELIHAPRAPSRNGRGAIIRPKPIGRVRPSVDLVTLNNHC